MTSIDERCSSLRERVSKNFKSFLDRINVINTDLGSLIGNTQYENFKIFLPHRFYLTLILVLLKPQKLPF